MLTTRSLLTRWPSTAAARLVGVADSAGTRTIVGTPPEDDRPMARERRRQRIGAAIDIGSYSVHVLVAEQRGDAAVERHDESAFLGLGPARSMPTGELGPQRAPQLIDTLAAFAQPGARPRRDDRHRRRHRPAPARRRRSQGHPRHPVGARPRRRPSLSHEEEALARPPGRAGRPPGRARDRHGRRRWRQHRGPRRAYPARQPVAGRAAARRGATHRRPRPQRPADARRAPSAARCRPASFRDAPAASPSELIAVGGTARSLLRVGPRLTNRILTDAAIERASTSSRRLRRSPSPSQYAVRLSRAHVLAAGAAILQAAMHRYRLDRVRVAKGGLREGLILACLARRATLARRGRRASRWTGSRKPARRPRRRPSRSPPSARADARTPREATGRHGRPMPRRCRAELAIAVRGVPRDRRSLGRRQRHPPVARGTPGRPCAVTAASFSAPRWSWRATSRSTSELASRRQDVGQELERVAKPLGIDPDLVDRRAGPPIERARRPPGASS